MQNYDLYHGMQEHNTTVRTKPFTEMVNGGFYKQQEHVRSKESEKLKKKASRIIFFISALCIISFTAGLVIGIKFAGGPQKEIVDDKTYNAVTHISQKVTDIIKTAKKKITISSFPKGEYPYVIRVGGAYGKEDSKNVAEYLSAKGHTVILSKNGDNYIVFTGPYKTEADAKADMKKFGSYEKMLLASKSRILERQ